MVLNDAYDAKRDADIRPERPIPQGVISVKSAWIVGFIMLATAFLISLRIGIAPGIATFALIFCILIYTVLHHSTVAAIPLMALCRALVFVVAFSAFTPPLPTELLVFCGVIALYTAILTFMGGSETKKCDGRAWVVWISLIPAIIPIVLYGSSSPIAWFAFAVYTIWIWTAWRAFTPTQDNKIQGMHSLLAGFALLDCILIASINEYFIMIVSIICFALTVAAHRRILGT